MKFILASLCIAFSINATAQSDSMSKPMVFSYVEQMPEPSVDINSYIAQNVKYPAFAKKNNIEAG